MPQITWIAPKNLVVNQIFGVVTGVALMPTTLDWSQIAYNSLCSVKPHFQSLLITQ